MRPPTLLLAAALAAATPLVLAQPAPAAVRHPTSVRVFPTAIKPGQRVRITVSAGTAHTDSVSAVRVVWGDGTVTTRAAASCHAAATTPGFGPTQELTHTYTRAGTFHPRGEVAVRPCDGGTSFRTTPALTTVKVKAGTKAPVVTMHPAFTTAKTAGAVIALDPVVTDPSGQVGALTVGWGDGTTTTPAFPAYSCALGPALQAPPSTYRTHQTHTYRHPGVYHVTVDMRTTGACTSRYLKAHVFKELLITVGGVEQPGNGPHLPVGSLVPGPTTAGDTTYPFMVDDPDGWISGLVATYADGTTETLSPGLAGCTDLGRSWPSRSVNGTLHHGYATTTATGAVTLSVTSTACDGSVPQTTVVPLTLPGGQPRALASAS